VTSYMLDGSRVVISPRKVLSPGGCTRMPGAYAVQRLPAVPDLLLLLLQEYAAGPGPLLVLMQREGMHRRSMSKTAWMLAKRFRNASDDGARGFQSITVLLTKNE